MPVETLPKSDPQRPARLKRYDAAAAALHLISILISTLSTNLLLFSWISYNPPFQKDIDMRSENLLMMAQFSGFLSLVLGWKALAWIGLASALSSLNNRQATRATEWASYLQAFPVNILQIVQGALYGRPRNLLTGGAM